LNKQTLTGLVPTWDKVGMILQAEVTYMRVNINTADLVDIRAVSVDKSLPQRERCVEFKRQIKDMENYKHKGLSVKAVYANDGTSLEDCLRAMLA
jgi:hypothetical protein